MTNIFKQPTNFKPNVPNVLLFRPHGYNLGDMLHYRGLISLLDKIYSPNMRNTYEIFAEEFIDESIIKQVTNKFDLIIVCGTPWFWWNLKPSFRYGEFKKILNVNKKAKKVAFAIGSSYPIPYEYKYATTIKTTAEFHRTNMEIIKSVWTDFSNNIITRDKLSVDILKAVNINATQMLCSSVFANDIHKIKRNYAAVKKLLVFHSPLEGNSVQYLTEEFIKEYYEMQYMFAVKYNPIVVCINDFEVDSYFKYAKEYCYDFEKLPKKIKCLQPSDKFNTWNTEKALLELFAESELVVSGRVHSGIPARSLGIPVIMLPTDTRARCVADAGGAVVYNKQQFTAALNTYHEQQHLNLQKIRNKYTEKMKKILNTEEK